MYDGMVCKGKGDLVMMMIMMMGVRGWGVSTYIWMSADLLND